MTGTRVVEQGQLVVRPLGMDRLWTFTRELRFALRDISGAFLDPSVLDQPKGWRFPGLRIPGKVSGTFRARGSRPFWNTSDTDRAIVILLKASQRFDRLVLTVDDPLPLVDSINAASRESG